MRKQYKVAIIGCGMIFNRHLEAIQNNSDNFKLVAVCDNDPSKLKAATDLCKVSGFDDYRKMLTMLKDKINFVVIATPNSLHYKQAIDALSAGYDVLVEKPVSFDRSKVYSIQQKADNLKQKAYAVLQVRYNPTVQLLKKALDSKLIGDIRSVNFIQRWQRPLTYFDGWRGHNSIGGGTLYECGIHYLDIVQTLFGVPHVLSTESFSLKHHQVSIEDTIYSIVKYHQNVPGSIEVTIAAEPRNLECSIAVLGSTGYIKLGGLALNEVTEAIFEKPVSERKWKSLVGKTDETLTPNSYGTHAGSCPNHPTLYREIADGRGFPIIEAMNSIIFIQDIYKKATINYS